MHQGSMPIQRGLVCLIAELYVEIMTRRMKKAECSIDSKAMLPEKTKRFQIVAVKPLDGQWLSLAALEPVDRKFLKFHPPLRSAINCGHRIPL